MPNTPPRIVIYGTGQFGQYITRFAVQKGWPIVAAFNRAGKKVGQDLGILAGLSKKIGVTVQDCDTASYETLDADIAIVTLLRPRLSENFVAYERLMNAGLNIADHTAESYSPFSSDPETAQKIDDLAKKNSVTYHGSGVWDMSRIWSGILLTGPCTTIDALFHRSVTDAETSGKAIMLQGGVSMTQDEFANTIGKGGGMAGGLYPMIFDLVLKKIGYTPSKITERLEPVFYDHPVYCRLLDKELEAGIVCGVRMICEATTKEGVTAVMHHEGRILLPGDTEHMYWKVDGKPSASVMVERDDTAHFTISSVFNRIPDVIAAEPGIKLITDLGPLKHTALITT
ncbi:MAG: hypothetical protein OXO50_18785 [Caldilineaceae bacterium]|nr:hypothetical protein [Caldilineaceae bacterium]